MNRIDVDGAYCAAYRRPWLLVLVLLVLSVTVVAESQLPLFDQTQLAHELQSINRILQQLTERKQFIQRVLDVEPDSLKPFQSAFVPVANVEAVPGELIRFVDVIRLVKRDKMGQAHFPVAATNDGMIYIFEASGGAPILKFASYDDPDQPQQNAACNNEKECPTSVNDAQPAIAREFSFAKDMQVGAGGSRPFVAVLQENGVVKVHGLSIKRGHVFEKASFWREEPSRHTNQSSSEVLHTQINVKRNVYIHLNATITLLQVYSAAQKSLLVMGTASGQVHIVDPTAAAIGKAKAFPIIKLDENVPVTHLAIIGNQLAVGSQDGSIRFVTLGSNRLVSSSRCALPIGLGSIASISWVEAKEKGRYLTVLTSEEDLLLFDRRSPDVPTVSTLAGKSSRGALGGLLTNMFGTPPGKTCVVTRRFPSMTAGSIVSLPHNQMMILTKRGPELFDTTTFFASHGQYDHGTEFSLARRSDFVHGGNAADFALILVRADGKGAHAYSFLASSLESVLVESGDQSTFDHVSSSWLFNAAAGSRGPFILVLAGLGFIMTWRRKFNTRNTGGPGVQWDPRTRGGRRGMGARMPRVPPPHLDPLNDGDRVTYSAPPGMVASGMAGHPTGGDLGESNGSD